jgi:hypothetical protein
VSCSFFLVDFVGAGLIFYSNWLLLSLSLVLVLVFLSSPPQICFSLLSSELLSICCLGCFSVAAVALFLCSFPDLRRWSFFCLAS